MDEVLTVYDCIAHAPHLLGYESDATIRHRLFGHVRSNVLAANDVGQQQGDVDGTGYNAYHFLRHGVPGRTRKEEGRETC